MTRIAPICFTEAAGARLAFLAWGKGPETIVALLAQNIEVAWEWDDEIVAITDPLTVGADNHHLVEVMSDLRALDRVYSVAAFTYLRLRKQTYAWGIPPDGRERD